MCWAAFTSAPLFQQSRFAERCQKVSLDGSERLADNRGAGDQHEVDRRNEVILMQAETLAEQPARPVAHHGIAQAAGSNHPQTGMCRRCHGLPIRNQAPGGKSFTPLPDAREIPPLLDPRRAPEPQALWRFASHGTGLDGSQTLASDTTAVAQDSAAAFAGITIQKSVLAFASDF